MVTDEQKKEIKKLVKKYKYQKVKDNFVRRSLDSRCLLESFDNDFDTQKYEKIKKYTED